MEMLILDIVIDTAKDIYGIKTGCTLKIIKYKDYCPVSNPTVYGYEIIDPYRQKPLCPSGCERTDCFFCFLYALPYIIYYLFRRTKFPSGGTSCFVLYECSDSFILYYLMDLFDSCHSKQGYLDDDMAFAKTFP